MRFKKLINSTWVVSLVSTAFSVIITMLFDILISKPILSTLIRILGFELKVWWVLLAVSIMFAFKLVLNRLKETKSAEPKYKNYTSDIFKKWKWAWKWIYYNDKNSWAVSELTALCPECTSTMLEHEDLINNISYECPLCDFYSKGESEEHPMKIQQLIMDKAKRME